MVVEYTHDKDTDMFQVTSFFFPWKFLAHFSFDSLFCYVVRTSSTVVFGDVQGEKGEDNI